jgi:2-keto-4-pentenoate hydratase
MDVSATDPRVERGLTEHLRRFRARVAAGEQRLGFKVAFNVQPVQEALGIRGSLIAGLTRTTLATSDRHSLAGSTRAALEAEVAVRLGRDLSPTMSEAERAACVAEWAPAIEIVDFDRPFDQLEAILGEGVFHRAVCLGPALPTRQGADLGGVPAIVDYAGERLCELDARAATGHIPDVLAHLARLLEPFGERLRSGDWLILGSMNPPTLARPDAEFSLSLAGIGRVAVTLTR